MTEKIKAPSMVYVKGEEMSRYTMDLVLEQWIKPFVDISAWEFFDLSAKNRDITQDQVLQDVIDSGKRVRSIFKEPTITPTNDQLESLGISKAWGSPNGAIRRGWNGITISRDTIMVEGLELGYKRPVFFERQAVGGEYGASAGKAGKGKVVTTYFPEGGGDAVVLAERVLKDKANIVVTYDNPLDNTPELARHFFSRCLKHDIIPYVVSKKTVFKWQETFWQLMKDVFDNEFKEKFNSKGLLDGCGNNLQHIISDAATMNLVKWTEGGFGMAAHNYDGDVLTDLMSQVHRSPGFCSSSLTGRTDDGKDIAEFEASHGTAADMEADRLAGKKTSLNPIGMVYALTEAMNHSAQRESGDTVKDVIDFTGKVWQLMSNVMISGKGTCDVAGENGSTTEEFISFVADEIRGALG